MVSILSPEATDSNEVTDISRPRRYRVLPDQTVPVAIQRFEEEEPASGELIDVSISGARLRSKAPLRFGETLVLHLESKAAGLSGATRRSRRSPPAHVRQSKGPARPSRASQTTQAR